MRRHRPQQHPSCPQNWQHWQEQRHPYPVGTTAAPENVVPTAGAAPGTVAAPGTALPGAPPTTPEGWAMLNPKYAKYKASEQAWAQRKAAVVTTFGAQVGDLYEQYLDKAAGDARKQFKADHPELRAVSLYTWNPKEYVQVEELFGKEAILQWAMTPPYAKDEATKKARSAWYDANPGAYLVNAWLSGRPSPRSEEEVTDDAEWEYNFGKDFVEAQALFGENIWSAAAGYKRSWDKATKSAYYDQYPQLDKFFGWWTGLLSDTGTTYTASAGAGSGYSSYGGGGGGGGGGKPYVRYPYFNPPKVYPTQLDNSMRLYAPDVKPWRAVYPNSDIDRATAQLRPDRLTAWKAPRRG